jgi:hypothetical protein
MTVDWRSESTWVTNVGLQRKRFAFRTVTELSGKSSWRRGRLVGSQLSPTCHGYDRAEPSARSTQDRLVEPETFDTTPTRVYDADFPRSRCHRRGCARDESSSLSTTHAILAARATFGWRRPPRPLHTSGRTHSLRVIVAITLERRGGRAIAHARIGVESKIREAGAVRVPRAAAVCGIEDRVESRGDGDAGIGGRCDRSRRGGCHVPSWSGARRYGVGEGHQCTDGGASLLARCEWWL